jgi:hypothetical protein
VTAQKSILLHAIIPHERPIEPQAIVPLAEHLISSRIPIVTQVGVILLWQLVLLLPIDELLVIMRGTAHQLAQLKGEVLVTIWVQLKPGNQVVIDIQVVVTVPHQIQREALAMIWRTIKGSVRWMIYKFLFSADGTVLQQTRQLKGEALNMIWVLEEITQGD